MTYSAPIHTEPGFWQTEILDILFPRSPNPAVSLTQDAELLRQLGFIPGLKEILMTRQVHALEHATVWVLTNMAGHSRSPNAIQSESLGGLSIDRGFYLYGTAPTGDISRAAQIALRRITAGEWDLAVHPRCGTNLSVGMVLTAGFALGASALLPKDPIGQLVGVGMAAVTAAQLTPELGALAQRYITTAIPFNLAISNISLQRDEIGRAAHFIEVQWVD
ncbi:MAG: DUF6391 domain-containing protein [Leptolyngbyaceae cyanobacterium bins.349]|nr:DUF6391 domain-containing protein [Leptolyngbyaceae cyanobacterium bins.349]